MPGRVDDDSVQAGVGDLPRLQRHGLRQPLHRGRLDGRRRGSGLHGDDGAGPGAGTGGVVMYGYSPDYYDPGSRRQTFTHWEAPFVAWLEAKGYARRLRDGLGPPGGSPVLTPYALMLTRGARRVLVADADARAHRDVHRARRQRRLLQREHRRYRIHFTDGTAPSPGQGAPVGQGPRDVGGRHRSDVRPENGVPGPASGQAGAGGTAAGTPSGTRVQHAVHWVYEGTGLKDGDVFGADPALPARRLRGGRRGLRPEAGLALATGDQGTPDHFFILESPRWPGLGAVEPSRPRRWASTRVDRGGIVFNGATTDWPCLVGRNAEVEQITRNVLDRLRLRAVPVLGPLPVRHGRAAAVAGEPAHFHVDTAGAARWGRSPTASWAGHGRSGKRSSAAAPAAGGLRLLVDAARATLGHRHGDGHGRWPSRVWNADVRATVGGGGPQDRCSRAAAGDGDARRAHQLLVAFGCRSRRPGHGRTVVRRGALSPVAGKTGPPAWRRRCAAPRP